MFFFLFFYISLVVLVQKEGGFNPNMINFLNKIHNTSNSFTGKEFQSAIVLFFVAVFIFSYFFYILKIERDRFQRFYKTH